MNAILAILVLGAMPPPPLVAAKATVDRGEVRTGPTLDQTFELANRSATDTLEITGVQTGCGCLKPTTSRTMLRPGETSTVTISVNTLTQPAGANSWKATVRYRIVPPAPAPPAVEPDRELELRIAATLIREIAVTPPSLAMSTATEATQIVTVSDLRATPLTVLAATTTSPHLTATLRPAARIDGLQTQAIELKVTLAYLPGTAEETVVLTTNDPACRELRIPVKITKRTESSIQFVPEAPVVRFAATQAEASTLIQLRRPGGGALQVAKVESTDPALTVKWSAEPGAVVTLRAVVDAAKANRTNGRADLKVTLIDVPGELIVPVVWSFP